MITSARYMGGILHHGGKFPLPTCDQFSSAFFHTFASYFAYINLLCATENLTSFIEEPIQVMYAAHSVADVT